MSEFSDQDIAEIRVAKKTAYDRLPQPDKHRRLAAVFHVAAEESGLGKSGILRAIAAFSSVVDQAFE